MSKKIVFFGLGSIGQRHLRLLLDLDKDVQVVAFRSHLGQQPIETTVPFISTWEELDDFGPDIAFITNPSDLHIKTALECARRGIHLFIEKPLDVTLDGAGELLQIVKEKNLSTYVAYCMRFHPMLQALKKAVEGEDVLHARIICSSYFPDWRPDQDHLKSYTANQEKSGGIIFELSHEIDYAAFLFGEVKSISGIYGKRSDVTVDADDFADIVLQHDNAASNVHLNFFSRKFQRQIEIDTSDKFFKADFSSGQIEVTRANGASEVHTYPAERDDMFIGQLEYFMSNLDNASMDNNLEEAMQLFSLITEFRKVA